MHKSPAFWLFQHLELSAKVSVTCSEKGNLQMEHLAQSPVQPVLECFQG